MVALQPVQCFAGETRLFFEANPQKFKLSLQVHLTDENFMNFHGISEGTAGLAVAVFFLGSILLKQTILKVEG